MIVPDLWSSRGESIISKVSFYPRNIIVSIADHTACSSTIDKTSVNQYRLLVLVFFFRFTSALSRFSLLRSSRSRCRCSAVTPRLSLLQLISLNSAIQHWRISTPCNNTHSAFKHIYPPDLGGQTEFESGRVLAALLAYYY